MSKHYAFLIAAAFLALPLAHADHQPVGAPKEWCESTEDMLVHEYGPATGQVLVGRSIETIGVQGVIPALFTGDAADGARDECWPEAWTDYHYEFAAGGGWIQSAAAPGCHEGLPVAVDHPVNPQVTILYDAFLTPVAAPIPFSVYADWFDNFWPADLPGTCGDGESDVGVDCVDTCRVGFPPGLDGTYQIYVHGTSGWFTAAGI